MTAYDDWIKTFAMHPERVEVLGDQSDIDVVVCRLITTPLLVSDNLVGHCSTCQRMIQFRPTAPKLPRRICDECVIKELAKDKDHKFIITENMLADLLSFTRKRQ